MGVSKALRYEVLRRDGFRCRYCGRSAETEGVALHVDHFTPVSQGGSDEPDNLLTACSDCNLGKAGRLPNDGMVADFSAAEAGYASARREAVAELQHRAEYISEVWVWGDRVWRDAFSEPMPGRMGDSLVRFHDAGLPWEIIREVIYLTAKRDIPKPGRVPYVSKVCWNKVGELDNRARELAEQSAAEASGPSIADEEYSVVFDLMDYWDRVIGEEHRPTTAQAARNLARIRDRVPLPIMDREYKHSCLIAIKAVAECPVAPRDLWAAFCGAAAATLISTLCEEAEVAAY